MTRLYRLDELSPVSTQKESEKDEINVAHRKLQSLC